MLPKRRLIQWVVNECPDSNELAASQKLVSIKNDKTQR